MRRKIIDGLLLVLGNFILSIGVSFFILPNNILSGGVAGISIALAPLLSIDTQIIINVIVIFCFFLGLFILGKDFAVKTIASSILFPFFISILTKVNYNFVVDPLMASIYGGLISGAGLGITFRTGASTGGMDIPPLILQKFTKIRVSIWIFIFDALTVLLGAKSFGLNGVLIGLISVFATTFAIDRVQLLGGETATQVMIITDKISDVLNYIHLHIDRGSTIIPARGGYTQQNKEIIMTVLMRDQYALLEKSVKEIDPGAFLIVSEVTEVHGQGFYRI